MEQKELEALNEFMGEKKAKKMIKLTTSYDKFIDKFKEDANAILTPLGYEVIAGLAFIKKEEKK